MRLGGPVLDKDKKKPDIFSLNLRYADFNIAEIEKKTGSHITPVMVKMACKEIKKFRKLLGTKPGKAKKRKIDAFRNNDSFTTWCNVIIVIQAYQK